MCWRLNDATGLELSQARFTGDDDTEIPVLRSASLAQIHVPYDNGHDEHWDLPGFGRLTAAMRPADCARGQRLPEGSSKPPLCVVTSTEEFRYAWSDYDFGSGNHTGEGQCVSLYTLTPADWYSYVNLWQFCDDASIRAMIGAGGTLAPEIFGDRSIGGPIGPGNTRYATAHYHNYFWRIEFALGDIGQTQIQQTDITQYGKRRPHTVHVFNEEGAATSAPARSWAAIGRTLTNSDGRPISYDLAVNNPAPYRSAPDRAYTDNDVYVTQYKACEMLAAHNKPSGCGQSIDSFVNGEHLDRPIIWVQESFHHLPRDEDEPIMNEHWSGFEMTPRGAFATNPLSPR